MFLVDKLDRDDGFGRVDGYGFADGCVCALADGFADEAEGKVRGQRGDLTLRDCQPGSRDCIIIASESFQMRNVVYLPQAARAPLWWLLCLRELGCGDRMRQRKEEYCCLSRHLQAKAMLVITVVA